MNSDPETPDEANDTDRPPAPIDSPTEPEVETAGVWPGDPEATVNLTGDLPFTVIRDDLSPTNEPPTSTPPDHPESAATQVYALQGDGPALPGEVARAHLRGLLEALVFASDKPMRAADLAKSASAPLKEVKELLAALKDEYAPRGVQLDEVAGGWLFRTSAAYAPFVRDLTKQKPVRLTRAQLETLAIMAYRQPITRPEIDDIRGVDSGPVLKLLLERDLVRILGKKDEPGRPLLYGTTTTFLELFGLKSLKDLPTLREFTELSEDSRRVVERELGDVLEEKLEGATPEAASVAPEADAAEPEVARDTLAPPGEGAPDDTVEGSEPEERDEPAPATQAGSTFRAAALSDADALADALADEDDTSPSTDPVAES